jgi:hypothetical protein
MAALIHSTLSGEVPKMGVLVVYSPILILLDPIAVLTIAEYCG